MPIEVKPRSTMLRWTAFWTVLSFASLSYAQQPPQGRYTPSQAEVAALGECQRMVVGEMGADKKIKSTYDIVYGQWLIAGERADDIISCLVERHGWIGLSAPDGRRGARAPRPPATESRSQDAVGYFLTGHSRAAKGDYRGALENFTKGVEIDPHYAQAYWDRAAVRAQLGDWLGALTDVNKALEIKPDVVPPSRAYEFRSLVRRMLGEHKESIEDSDKAIGIDPRNARAYENRGISRMILGDLDGARMDLDKALQYETDPRRIISIYDVLNKIANVGR